MTESPTQGTPPRPVSSPQAPPLTWCRRTRAARRVMAAALATAPIPGRSGSRMPRNRLVRTAMIAILFAGGVGVSAPTASAADAEPEQQQLGFPDLEREGWLLHGQTTYIVQGHPKFTSP